MMGGEKNTKRTRQSCAGLCTAREGSTASGFFGRNREVGAGCARGAARSPGAPGVGAFGNAAVKSMRAAQISQPEQAWLADSAKAVIKNVLILCGPGERERNPPGTGWGDRCLRCPAAQVCRERGSRRLCGAQTPPFQQTTPPLHGGVNPARGMLPRLSRGMRRGCRGSWATRERWMLRFQN